MPWVPEILKVGTRGVRSKIWTFLYLNQPDWFTSNEISEHLDMPLSTVQVALKEICSIAPRIEYRDKPQSGKGRPEKEYSFQKTPVDFSS
jgi:predicted transcriptional regulator